MNPSVYAFDRFAEEYDQWFDDNAGIYATQVDHLRRYIPTGAQTLETGVGSGRFSSRLGIRNGIDPSLRLLAMARSRGLEAVLGKGEFLPYRDGIFDGVLMMTAICFMDDVDRSFHEAFRVLKAEGMLVVAFLEKDGEIAQREEGSGGRFFRYARFFSVAEVTAALAGAGFSGVFVSERLRSLCIMTATKE
jgi:ubiquinone/menaquinone biosynthesis C-methylase UbiE